MNHTPKLCHHKAAQQGYVTLNGKEHYLGHWSRDQRKAPPSVRAEYDVLISRWLANGRKLPDESTPARPVVTVNAVILAFVEHATGHHVQREKGSNSEVEAIKAACRVVAGLFGRIPAAEFGPKALKQVRQKMLSLDWSRAYTNRQVNRVKRMFRFAVAEELVPPSVNWGLSAVAAIRKGEPGVRETEPVKPVPEEWIEAALLFMSAQVAALVKLQMFTGARPGEIVTIRGCDIDRSGKVWVFKPEHHKTEHRGHSREVYIGPRAQAVLLPWLKDDPNAYLFSPAEAEAQRHEERSQNRATPRWASHMKRNATKKKATRRKKAGDRYTPSSYRRAIAYACEQADAAARERAVERAREQNPGADVSGLAEKVFVPKWAPNRLRHNAATAMRKEFGIELAQLALGHTTLTTTLVYAERDRDKVMGAFERIG
ncbi:site-specific integrase [Gemmata sp. G18]|uniref:Site-specific integrase n=1 Tax=Gemmata palustris TaxID=2822762 RepID=A0ABS5C4K2_9BACT|nr:site-specific integrase [Gemmata palustris]MBP3960924.1 site-specific integrase [Gemmata palustris]